MQAPPWSRFRVAAPDELLSPRLHPQEPQQQVQDLRKRRGQAGGRKSLGEAAPSAATLSPHGRRAWGPAHLGQTRSRC